MGGHAWFYFVPHEADIDKTLETLRQREFKAGRYNPAVRLPEFPVNLSAPSPGAQHASIAEAFEASDADGTRSILDMERVGESPDYGVVVPMPPAQLMELYDTQQPTRKMIEGNMDFLFDELERGQGIYIVVYEDGNPSEIFFAGFSYD